MDALSSLALGVFTFISAILGAFSNNATYFAPAFVPQLPEARIIFGGDMMFDRSVRLAAAEEGDDFILACLAPVLSGVDLVVANLEGPITGEPSVSAGSLIDTPENYTFTFPLSTAALLKRHGFALVNLGNNHIENFGHGGVLSTVQALRAAGVDYFGDPIEQRVARTSIDGIDFAFVNFNQFAQSSTRAKTLEQIESARGAGAIVIVYAHWGDEYVAANQYQKDLARTFIDAGAEIVIGSHPHVVQEHEQYRGKHIYYSLGNLVFDQYWEEAVRSGLMIQVTFSRKGVVSIQEIPVTLERDRRTCPTMPSR